MDEIKEEAKRFIGWSKGKKISPYKIELRPTDKCNLRCLTCYSRLKKRFERQELPLEKYIEIIKEAGKIGVRRFHISGNVGEPLFRKEKTFRIMKEIKEQGMVGSLVTNGTLFSRNMIYSLVRVEWDQIFFSLDGPSAQVHDSIKRVKGSFNKVIKAVKRFQKFKKKLGKDKPTITITLVINSKNYNKIVDLFHLSHNLKVKNIFLQPLVANKENPLSKELILSEKQRVNLQEELEKASQLAKKYEIDHNIDEIDEKLFESSTDISKVICLDKNSKNKKLTVTCFSPFFFMLIDVDGKVGICSAVHKTPENIEKKSLLEMWGGSYFNALREKLTKGEVPKICENCCSGTVIENRLIRKKILENPNFENEP